MTYDFSFLLLAYFYLFFFPFFLFPSVTDGFLGWRKGLWLDIAIHRRSLVSERIFDLLLLAMADDNAEAFQFLAFFRLFVTQNTAYLFGFFLLLSLAGFMRQPGASTAVPDVKPPPPRC